MIRLLKIVVSATLIGVLAWNLDLSEFVAGFLNMDPLLAFAAFVLLWIQYPLSAVKWQVALRLHGIEYGTGYLLRAHCIAFFFNNFLPTSIGGDAYRAYRTMENAERKAHAISAVVMERLIGLVALVFLGFLAAIYLIFRGNLLHRDWIIAATAVAAVGMVVVWIFWKTGSHEKLWARLKKVGRLEPMIDSIRVINANQKYFNGLLLYSVFYQAVAIYTVSLIFASVGFAGKFFESSFTAAAAGVAGILPISINGIGVMESSFVVAAMETGLPYAPAVMVALFLRAFMFLASIAFGILYALEPADKRMPDDNAVS
jgi:uncharacterized protein (TIRG00374 family)